MKFVRHEQESFTNIVEEDPENEDADAHLDRSKQNRHSLRLLRKTLRLASQASGTQNPVFVFRDAFPTKITAALRTTGSSFTLPVIGASAGGKLFHILIEQKITKGTKIYYFFVLFVFFC